MLRVQIYPLFDIGRIQKKFFGRKEKDRISVNLQRVFKQIEIKWVINQLNNQ